MRSHLAMNQFRRHVLCSALLVAIGICGAMPDLHAQEAAQRKSFNVPAQPATSALNAFAEQADITLVFSQDLVQEITTHPLQGTYTTADSLQAMLKGTGLTIQRINDGTISIGDEAPSAGTDRGTAQRGAEGKTLDTITVTGTRIRGGDTPSPVIAIGSERIKQEGFTDLGEVIRSVPQNFRGGQNPGVIGVASGASNQDLTGGSALNLRGLGPDASLTLLNGRRLAYDGFSQAVDISAIPVEAVERIEIVPDGSSAIYGSDAVGGVANVILARNFDGVAVGTRYGGATDGGLATREYTATAGTTWASGGLMVALRDASVDPIYARQRNYTDHLLEPYTIYNGWDSRNGLASIHQSIGNVAELRIDALRTDRETTKYATQGSSYYQYMLDASVALVSPSIEFFLPHDWSLTVGGTRGNNENFDKRYFVSGAGSNLTTRIGIYNKSRSYEMGAEGPLFRVGDGDARLALGVGSRTDHYAQLNQINGTGYGGSERARYAYTELSLPLVSPSSSINGIHRLELSAAVRGEDYNSFGRVTTPKIGAIYGPNTDLTLKASWGRSFKAPTLAQRYLDKTAYLWSAPATGGSGYPPGSTALMSYGGNSELHAERARTWTTSLAVHPEALPGLEAELTVFNVDYTDRVVDPVNYQQALSNPVYAQFVEYSPTPERQAELLAIYNSMFYNLSGTTYEPSKVVAIIHAQSVNAARQRIRGVDLSGAYGFGLAEGRLTIRGAVSWLDSTQQTSAGQPENDLAGTVYNPAKLNTRVGLVWVSGGFSASGFANHTSGVTNRLIATSKKTASFTTVDATLSYDTGQSAGAYSGLTFGLSAQNLLNREPPRYTAPVATWVPYDATNYSPIGRFVSVSVLKRW